MKGVTWVEITHGTRRTIQEQTLTASQMEPFPPESAGADMRAPLAGAVAYVSERLLMMREMSGRRAARGEMVRVGGMAKRTVDRGRIRGAVARGDRGRDPALCGRARSDVARLRGAVGFLATAWPCAYAFYVTKYVEMLGTVIVLLGAAAAAARAHVIEGVTVPRKRLPACSWCACSARAHLRPPRDRTPTHRSRRPAAHAVAVLVSRGRRGLAGDQLRALVRYGEPGRSSTTMRCNLVACTTSSSASRRRSS